MLSVILKFLAATEDSVKGFLNPEQLYRSILLAMGSASTVGAVLSVLQAVLSNVATIFPNPSTAALATGLITVVMDLLRRLNQGTTPTPSPTPAPAPASN